MIFGYDQKQLEDLKAIYTASEIAQEPEMWRRTYDIILNLKEEIKAFQKDKITKDTRIIFTGAGTSDYVGDTICNYVNQHIDARVEAIATTDIVANPAELLEKETPTILVSFGRSGNSPESVGAFHVVNAAVDQVIHLVITCAKDGKIANLAREDENNFVIVLPDETNDKSFAMTSSFSSMLLAALLFFDIDHINENQKIVDVIAKQGDDIIQTQWKQVKELSERKPGRFIYLGASWFAGLVQEMALKNLELTNGMIPTMNESVLGFRHGPKTFMDDTTYVIVAMTQDTYTNRYIIDLMKEIAGNQGEHTLIGLSYTDDEEVKSICDEYLCVNGKKVLDVYATLNYVLYAQMFGLFNSIETKNTPDNPSPDGTVNRVVQGVTLYDYIPER